MPEFSAPATTDPLPATTSAPAETPEPAPLRSVHTTTFPELLKQLGISIAVTTYQAGKLLFLREDSGKLNTHFRAFRRPMGLAVTRGRIAVGTSTEVWDFHDVPAVAARASEAVPVAGGEERGDRWPAQPMRAAITDAGAGGQCFDQADARVEAEDWLGLHAGEQ